MIHPRARVCIQKCESKCILLPSSPVTMRSGGWFTYVDQHESTYWKPDSWFTFDSHHESSFFLY